MTTRRKLLTAAAASPAALAAPALAQSTITWRMQTYAGAALAEHPDRFPDARTANRAAGSCPHMLDPRHIGVVQARGSLHGGENTRIADHPIAVRTLGHLHQYLALHQSGDILSDAALVRGQAATAPSPDATVDIVERELSLPVVHSANCEPRRLTV